MTIEEKMQLFEQIGRALVESSKKKVDFQVTALNNTLGITYRVQLWYGKKSRGYACPYQITAKDFEKRFEINLEMLIK